MKKIYLIILFLTFLSSCTEKKENFGVTNLTSKFRYLEKFIQTGPDFQRKSEYHEYLRETGIKDKSLLEDKTYLDARFLDLSFDILNNTGEKIEEAEINTILKIQFKSDTKTYIFPPRKFLYNSYEIWDINITKHFDSNYIFNDLQDYENTVFEHKPEKIYLTLYIKAKNSVGFDNTEVGDLIYDEEIILDSWE